MFWTHLFIVLIMIKLCCFDFDSCSPSLLIILARVAGGSSGTGLNGKNDIDASIIIQQVPVLFSVFYWLGTNLGFQL